MNNKKRLLNYSMELAMLKQLFIAKLIDEKEYKLIEKRINKDYGVISPLTA